MRGAGNVKNEIGNFYGNLAVVARAPEKAIKIMHDDKLAHWICVCVCGREVSVAGQALRNGNNTSCGCMRAIRCAETGRKNIIHGQARTGQVTPEYRMWAAAATRAKRDGTIFTIKLEDIRIPKICPLLGIPLVSGNGFHTAASPSLDRFDTTKGYTPDNIWVISFRANSWKSNFTLTELRNMVTILEDKARAYEIPVSTGIRLVTGRS
jgi:hypothetical protein